MSGTTGVLVPVPLVAAAAGLVAGAASGRQSAAVLGGLAFGAVLAAYYTGAYVDAARSPLGLVGRGVNSTEARRDRAIVSGRMTARKGGANAVANAVAKAKTARPKPPRVSDGGPGLYIQPAYEKPVGTTLLSSADSAAALPPLYGDSRSVFEGRMFKPSGALPTPPLQSSALDSQEQSSGSVAQVADRRTRFYDEVYTAPDEPRSGWGLKLVRSLAGM